jgi:transcriptional regulator with XRE-family HTH domain
MTRPDDTRPDAGGRPTDAYRIFGHQLQQLRTACGVSTAGAARCIGGSIAKISRLEGGKCAVKDGDLDQLLNLYQVTKPDTRKALLGFASRLNDWRAWDAGSGWLCSYLILESMAGLIRTYEAMFIPGLLQTRAYAETVVRRHYRHEHEIRRRVDLRIRRQRAVLERGTPRLWAIVDRAALDADLLRGCVPRPEDVMREQIEFLIRAADRTDIVIQVLPRGAGFRAGVATSFSLLRLALESVADIAYLEQIDDAIFLDDPDKADSYQNAMEWLSIHAGKPDEALETLKEALAKIPA